MHRVPHRPLGQQVVLGSTPDRTAPQHNPGSRSLSSIFSMHPTAQLRELVEEIMKHSQPEVQARSQLSPGAAWQHPLGLCSLVQAMVPFNDLARLVHRLQRRSSGLQVEWIAFCNVIGDDQLVIVDPFRMEAMMLLKFLCWAIAHAPDRVLALRPGSSPILRAALELSREKVRRNGHATEQQDSHIQCSNSQALEMQETGNRLRTLLGIPPPPPPPPLPPAPCHSDLSTSGSKNLLSGTSSVRTEDARLVDLTEESTVTCSLASNSDRSEIGDSDAERRATQKMHAKLSEEEGQVCGPGENLDVDAPSSAMLWLGPERPEPDALPMTNLSWQ